MNHLPQRAARHLHAIVFHLIVRASMGLLLLGMIAGAFPGSIAVAAADEYRIGPRDVIEVVVWGQPELSGKYTLRGDGAFEFPLIGDVKVAGLTAAEVETRLRDMLGNGYINSPKLSAKVIEYNSQRVFVVGEVGKGGEVKLTGALTLLEALSQAGGVEKTAGPEVVVLRRPENSGPANGPLVAGQAGVTELARISLDDMQTGKAKDNVALKDGDTIFVPKAQQVYVTGEVVAPGALTYVRDLTVIQAISLAGGTTKLGSDKKARIVRIIDGEKKELKAKLTDVLQPGDIVKVPTRMF
jgi:polysaccharide export outer membrane protein